MNFWNLNLKSKKAILALGAESDGNFSFYKKKKVYFTEGFGDLLEEKKFHKFREAVLNFIAKNGKPDVIISDLHPLFHTTIWGKELANQLGAEFVQVQHHLAHIYSVIGDYVIRGNEMPYKFLGVACDGTGYGLDEKIWGGEVFKFSNRNIKRIGHLENQILIGGELAIHEPARMLISILGKFLSKDEVYRYVKNFYTKNEYQLLWNQMQQGFNCIETSSTGRVLDAVSVLLGFSKNERLHKHAPIESLEKNSSEPYDIEPLVKGSELQTTRLFEYLIQNLDQDKKRLAATAQIYLAKGLWEICSSKNQLIFFSGGIANNIIISEYLVSKGVIVSQKIPRGDTGISFGQLMYYLADSGD